MIFDFFFEGKESPGLILVLRSGSGVTIKAQAAARVWATGHSLTADTQGKKRFTSLQPLRLPRKKALAVRIPPAAKQGNTGNVYSASMLCACSAVLIYLDLR